MKRCMILTLAALTTLTALAEPKQDLSTRREEAAIKCGEYVITNAKDPDSIKMEDYANFQLGNMMTRNHVYVAIQGMGRNTYGAVLKTTFNCDVLCKQGEPCRVVEANG